MTERPSSLAVSEVREAGAMKSTPMSLAAEVVSTAAEEEDC